MDYRVSSELAWATEKNIISENKIYHKIKYDKKLREMAQW